MERFLSIVLIQFVLLPAVQSQEIDTSLLLPSVSIQSNRIQETFLGSAHTITILNEQELSALPVQTVQEVLQYTAGVSLNARGFPHVQSDLSVRGGGFDQALVLVDGIKLNDAQTGHHLMNIPVPLEQIERIEIIKGPSARIYGPNAYSGVINIITKDFEKEQVTLKSYGGNFNSGGAALSFQFNSAPLSHQFSARKDFSGGYRYNTAYDLDHYYYKLSTKWNQHHFDIHAGYTAREFGANGFYADISFKEQEEAVQTSLVALQHSYSGKNYTIRNNMYWRRNQDIYVFNRKDPYAYRNFHLGNNAGIESHLDWHNALGNTGVGLDVRTEILRSNNLGAHNRNTLALALEHRFHFFSDKLSITPGVFLNYYSDHGFNALPGIDANWMITDNFSLYAAIGNTFRVPTYTDLYYEDPANVGNPDLEPEKALNSELGVKYSGDAFLMQASVFRRNNLSLIDWRKDEDIWRATNIDSIVFTGVEGQFRWSPSTPQSKLFLEFIDLQYTYLHGVYYENDNFESRYTFNHQKHRLISKFHLNVLGKFSLSPVYRYEVPFNENIDDYHVLDVRVQYHEKNWKVFAEVINLTNTSYFGAGGVPMPDRWLRAGFSVRFLTSEE